MRKEALGLRSAGAIGGGIVALFLPVIRVLTEFASGNNVVDGSYVVATALLVGAMFTVGALLGPSAVTERRFVAAVVFGFSLIPSYLLATSLVQFWPELTSYSKGLAALVDAGTRYMLAINLMAFILGLPAVLIAVAAAGLAWLGIVGRLVRRSTARPV